MSFKELLESWRETAAAARTARTFAVHLPLEEAAQLAALAEMFPGRSSEQLITELLGTALNELAAAMPYVPGSRVISTDEQGDPIFEDVGPTPRFMQLSREHRRGLESGGKRRSPGKPALPKATPRPKARKRAAPPRRAR